MTKPMFQMLILSCWMYSDLLAAQESYWLGDSRGPYATGVHVDMWVDEDRQELTTTEPDDKRKVMIQIWYPASPADNVGYAPYVQDLTLFKEHVQEWGAELAQLPTRSVLNAPMRAREGGYPVLLYSHGGNSPLFSGTAQTEFLASHGYVVVSVAHTDDSAIVRFPDGEPYQPVEIQQVPSDEESAGWSQLEIYNWQKEHLQDLHGWHLADLEFALNRLETLNQSTDNIFHAQLDLEHVGAFGWSRGGATSFQASVDDSRVKAAANLDGSIYGRSIESTGSTRPLLLLESTNSYFDPLNDSGADPEIEELWSSVEKDLWGMFSRSTHDWYRAKIVGTNHTQFSDFPLSNSSPPAEFLKPQRTRGIINAILLEFFNKYLGGGTDFPILSGQRVYPELRLITEEVESD